MRRAKPKYESADQARTDRELVVIQTLRATCSHDFPGNLRQERSGLVCSECSAPIVGKAVQK